MAIRPILTAPDPRLKAVSAPVAEVDDALRRLMDDMIETMYAAPGIGLAAIQVGVPKRVVVIDLQEEEVRRPLRLVNPEIVTAWGETAVFQEGCLSVPDQYEEVERPASCLVRFLDYDGRPQELAAEGLLAVCIQHEIDHLDGVLFIDRISKLKRNMILRRLQKQRRLEKESA
jgi:peptide deformylase